MLNIAYRITAVPERKTNAIKEAIAINEPISSIYMDDAHRGNIWNKFRVYEDILKDGSYSHVCMNDDDLIFSRGYKELVSEIVQRFPDAIHTFYDEKIASDKPAFFLKRGHYMHGAACVIPTKYLEGFLHFYQENLSGFRWDDTSMSIYALLNDIDVYLFSPKIVDVIETPSTLSFRKGRFQPHNKGFCELIDASDIKSAPVRTARGKFNLHLPKDHKVSQLCEKKWKDNEAELRGKEGGA